MRTSVAGAIACRKSRLPSRKIRVRRPSLRAVNRPSPHFFALLLDHC